MTDQLELFSLSGKTIIIIGSSRGLGEHLALYLHANNVNVLGISRGQSAGNFKQISLDISDQSKIETFTDYLSKNNINVDGIVLNSSISSSPKASSSSNNEINLQTFEDFKKIIDINLLGIYNLVISTVPFLNKNSSIVGISSIGSQLGFPNNPAYQASKAGIDAMMRALAVDLAHLNIRANHINLGYFKTPMTEISYNNLKLRKARADRTILSRWGEKEEFLGPVCFLLSNASSYINASGINVDGGWKSKGL